MHGGRSTGPRSPEGRDRIRAARTIHGRNGAEARAFNRFRLTMLRRNSVTAAAIRYRAHLPPVFIARLYDHATELLPPSSPPGSRRSPPPAPPSVPPAPPAGAPPTPPAKPHDPRIPESTL